MAMRECKWYEEPMVILDFIPPDTEKYEKLDIRKDYEIKKELGFNTEHLEVHDVALGESGIAYYPSEYAVECRKNILQEVLDIYDTDLIKPIVYFNVHWLSETLVGSHGEWAQKDINGNTIKASYGSGGYCCVNSPYKDYAFGVIRTLGKNKIKGIFLDGPIVHEKGCYCDSCRSRFKESYGYGIELVPEGRDVEKDWIEFKKKSIANFMRLARENLKQVNKDAIIYMNSPQLAPTKLCSRDTRMTEAYQDILLAEGGFLTGDLRKVNIWKPAATAMLLEEQSKGKPYCVAISGRLAPWSRYLLSASEIKIAYAMSLSNGAWIWFGVYNDNKYNRALSSVKEFNGFIKENKKWLMQTRSVSKIALLWSYHTANYYETSSEETDFTEKKTKGSSIVKGDYKASFDGWFEAMSRTQQLFDIIDNESLREGRLNKYELLILPDVSCMSDEEIEIIERYVENGGRLICSFDTSLYNEFGARRKEPGLGKVTGVEGFEGIETFQYDHIKLDADRYGLTGNIGQDLLPAARLGVQYTAGKPQNVIACYREKQITRYSELPEISDHPYISYNEYGRGKVLYFSGNIGAFYNEFRVREYENLIENSINLLSGRILKVQAESDINSLHVTLRKQDENLILHVVNYTGAMTRPIQAVVGLRNIAIEIYDFKDTDITVETLVDKNNAAYELRDGTLRVVLRQMREYEIIVITRRKTSLVETQQR